MKKTISLDLVDPKKVEVREARTLAGMSIDPIHFVLLLLLSVTEQLDLVQLQECFLCGGQCGPHRRGFLTVWRLRHVQPPAAHTATHCTDVQRLSRKG